MTKIFILPHATVILVSFEQIAINHIINLHTLATFVCMPLNASMVIHNVISVINKVLNDD